MTPETSALLAQTINAVEQRLSAVFDAQPGVPARLTDAMRHAVLGGGKRLRPFLVMQTAALFGLSGSGPIEVGAALELVHCYSLVHDDLPSMDNDALRRGQPTVHIKFDEATAILAGDALQTLAFELLAGPAVDPDPSVRADLVVMLARASGAAGMVGGQLIDLTAEGRFGPASFLAAEIQSMQAMKTGALFSFAVLAGARLGRASAAETADLARYADRLGFAFQIADDLLDAEGDAATVGKATGKDAAAGKATLVSLMGLAGAREALARTVREGEASLARFDDKASGLVDIIRYIASRTS